MAQDKRTPTGTGADPVAERTGEPAPDWPRKVRTTMEPGKVIEVDEREYADLSGWGLLVNEDKGE